MATKKGGLGRGLGSLFEESAAGGGEGSGPQSLPLSEIEPDRDQPRKHFDPGSLTELADSIRQHGVLQPVTVRPNPAGGYKIIAGERRWRAAREAGLTEIPALVKEVGDAEAMELALIENLQREDLNPVEEAFGYRQLMESCSLTQEQAAERLARSRPAVANALRLLGLPQPVLQLVRQGALSAGHARAILAVPGEEGRQQAARLAVEQQLNVRQTEALCRRLAKPKKAAPPPQRPALPDEVELALRQALGAQVKVKYRKGRGSLEVEFYSDEQLRAFANLLGQYEKGPSGPGSF